MPSKRAATPCRVAALVSQHRQIVRDLVSWQMRRLPYVVRANIDRMEFETAGLWGLHQAAMSFKEETGNTFPAFARHRIVGAILDLLREYDPVGRHHRAQKSALDIEVPANVLAVAFPVMGEQADLIYKVMEDRSASSPEEMVIAAERARVFWAAVEKLKPREKIVVHMFVDGHQLKQIGNVLKVTESRISQIMNLIVAQLQTELHSCRDLFE